jgi:hypothetical protein
MATGAKRAWLTALAAAVTVACSAHAPPAGPAAGPPLAPAPAEHPDAPPVAPPAAGPFASLEAPEETADRIELSSLLLPRADRQPSLLRERLLISGIDPHEVGQYLEAYNRRSDLVQFTPDGVAFAPHALERMLSLSPDKLLQFRFSGQAGKLVFRLSFP